MEEIKRLIKFSKDLEEKEPEKTAYWHLQQLRKEMEQALNIQSVSKRFCNHCEKEASGRCNGLLCPM